MHVEWNEVVLIIFSSKLLVKIQLDAFKSSLFSKIELIEDTLPKIKIPWFLIEELIKLALLILKIVSMQISI